MLEIEIVVCNFKPPATSFNEIPTKKRGIRAEIYTKPTLYGWNIYVKKIRNKGFTLVELLVVLVVVVVVGSYGLKQYKHNEQVRYYNTQVQRLNEVGSLIQSAVFQMGVPESLEQMIANGYDYSCDNMGGDSLAYCSHINETMWGEKIKLHSENDGKIHSIVVPMKKLSEKDRNLFIGLATKSIPHTSVDGENLKISYSLLSNKTWNVSDGGSGGDIDGDKYIPSNGSKPLTGDWIVGDKQITNVNDLTLTTTDGKSQLSVSNGLIRESGTVLSGESVVKPICTKKNTEPKILTWFNGIAPSDLIADEFTSISSVYARPIDAGDSWTLWTSFTALSTVSDKYEVYNSYADRNVAGAKKADVLMGYLTMCRSTK